MKNALKNKYHIMIFAVFALFQFATLQNVFMFGDDYYYATFLNSDLSHFISENLLHYRETNGRAIVRLFAELFLSDASLIIWKIVCTLVICAIVFLVSKLASKSDFNRSLTISCALFALIDIGMANQTLYWLTGSLNYVFPVPIMLFYFYIYTKFHRSKTLPKYTFIVAFFSCAMIEQCGFASLIITMMICYTYVLNKKKPDTALIFCIIASIIGAAILFLAPGNFVRQTYYPEFYEASLYNRIILNSKSLTSLILSKKGMANIIFVYLAARGIIVFAKLKKARYISALHFAACTCTVLFASTNAPVAGYVSAPLVIIALLFDIMIAAIDFFTNKNDGTDMFFLVMTVGLQAAMLISPVYGPRTVFVSFVMLMIPTIKNITQIFQMIQFKSSVKDLLIAALSIAVMAFLIAPNAIGYSVNAKYQKANAENIENCIKNKDKTVTIYVLPREDTKYTMPYDSTYHEYWFKILHGIEDVKIEYSFPEK